MKEWFKDREVPKEVDLKRHGRVEDTGMYIETALAIIANSPVNSHPFRAAYKNLYRLKKHLEQQ